MTSTRYRIFLTANYSPWSPYSGGGQYSTHQLASALSQLGHDVTVIFSKVPGEVIRVPANLTYQIEWAAFVGMKSSAFAPLRSLNTLTFFKKLRGLLKNDTTRLPMVVHSQGEEAAFFSRLKKDFSFSLLSTPRQPLQEVIKTSGTQGWWRKRPKFMALARTLREAQRFCPTSEKSAEEFLACFDLDSRKLVVVPNGIHPAFLRVERKNSAASGPIVFVGRLAKSKGIVQLVKAYEGLRGDSVPELHVVGRGPESVWIESFIQKHGLQNKVKLLGWQEPEHTAELLSHACMAALPSLEESFGNTVVEALAAGVPTVTTSAGSLAEIVGGKNIAKVISPENHEELQLAIQDLLDHPREAEVMATRARDAIRPQYSWDATARRYVGLYDELFVSVGTEH
ncbi:MAG: glycosyltransferase family 4 protein [Myxococcales bacterium]|nr:MAG: glycosyltransferase family 4 protein [Myxococcales bacterium]